MLVFCCFGVGKGSDAIMLGYIVKLTSSVILTGYLRYQVPFGQMVSIFCFAVKNIEQFVKYVLTVTGRYNPLAKNKISDQSIEITTSI